MFDCQASHTKVSLNYVRKATLVRAGSPALRY